MNILFIGDPHIRTDNTEEVDILIHEIERVCYEFKEEIHYIVIGGDVMHYHERIFTQALNKSLEFINKLRKIAYTYILVGNHDAVNNSIFLTDHHWMNALKAWDNVKIVDDIVECHNFILCPYVPPGRLIEAIQTKIPKEEWLKKSVIFAHQEIKGCKMGAIISSNGDEWNPSYPLLISGHIHDHQKIGDNVIYPGTPLQHAFGDSDTRFVTMVHLNNFNTPILSFLSLNVPKKYVLKSNMSNLSNQIEKINKDNKNDKLKIKLEASTEEFNMFKQSKEYKYLLQKGIKIQLQKNDMVCSLIDKKENENFTAILNDMIKNDDIVINIYKELFI